MDTFALYPDGLLIILVAVAGILLFNIAKTTGKTRGHRKIKAQGQRIVDLEGSIDAIRNQLKNEHNPVLAGTRSEWLALLRRYETLLDTLGQRLRDSQKYIRRKQRREIRDIAREVGALETQVSTVEQHLKLQQEAEEAEQIDAVAKQLEDCIALSQRVEARMKNIGVSTANKKLGT